MILTQFTAMLMDSYRDLNSKKLFWITMGLSGGAMGLFALVGVTDHGLTFMGNRFGSEGTSALLYKSMFTYLAVGVWLTWAATILALVSTASIFPDFITAGSVDLYLSKPISRLRLFLTKYLAGLLFVALQVAVFCVVGFFVLGFRGGLWLPGIFLGIPIITLFFSYLFCIQALIGVWTRSTIASILLTILVWLAFVGVNWTESISNKYRAISTLNLQDVQMVHKLLDARISELEAEPGTAPATTVSTTASTTASASKPAMTAAASASAPASAPESELDTLRKQRVELLNVEKQLVDSVAFFDRVQKWSMPIKNFLPKTNDTVDLLDRVMISADEYEPKSNKQPTLADLKLVEDLKSEHRQNAREAVAQFRDRPLWWVVGTSLIFEAVIVAIAGWLFCRRDY